MSKRRTTRDVDVALDEMLPADVMDGLMKDAAEADQPKDAPAEPVAAEPPKDAAEDGLEPATESPGGGAEAAKDAPAVDDVASEAIVCRKVRNPRLVIAKLGAVEVRVRVRNCTMFPNGMKIPIRHVANDVWELTRKEPRGPGRW